MSNLLRTWMAAATAMVAAAAVVVTATAASAIASTTVAAWQLNEPSGASTMIDSSGFRLHGDIGDEVVTNTWFNGSRGYHFTGLNTSYRNPERLVTVPDHPLLDPGSGDYAVTIRLRTGAGGGNIVQKGQSGTAGGFFKIDMSKGIVYCVFRGSAGQRAIGSGTPVNDKQWHTIRCERRADGVYITVDGKVTRSTKGRTGTISNSYPLSIGGKTSCNQRTVGCDYFIGILDSVRVEY